MLRDLYRHRTLRSATTTAPPRSAGQNVAALRSKVLNCGHTPALANASGLSAWAYFAFIAIRCNTPRSMRGHSGPRIRNPSHAPAPRKPTGPIRKAIVTIELTSSTVTQIFTAFGKLGVSAEDVAKHAAEQARAYMHSTAAVDEHLADQLLLPFALAGKGSFTATSLNMHAKTNMEVIRAFLPVRFEVVEAQGRSRVSVQPE